LPDSGIDRKIVQKKVKKDKMIDKTSLCNYNYPYSSQKAR
jgi:hypothetical protein